MVEEINLDELFSNDGEMDTDEINLAEISLGARLKSVSKAASSDDGGLRRMNNMLQDKRFMQVLDE